MTTSTGSDLREYIRGADDSAYVASAAAETPRSRVVDLYGPLGEARRRAPVHPHKQAELIGQEDYRKEEAFKVAFSCALSFEHCQHALTDERLSSKFWLDTIGRVWGRNIIGMDGAEHRRHRGLISQAFTRRSLDRWQETAIQPAVHGLIDRFEHNGSADLYREFTLLFPVYIITEMMGLPYEDIERFNTWAGETVGAFYDMERALQASRNLESYLSPLIEERRDGDGEDLITLLANAELDGSRLETIEIVSFLRLLLPAGGETTARSTASMLLGLMQKPDQLDALIADRSLLPQAIEEGLRWEPPLMSISRIAVEDLELGGLRNPQRQRAGGVDRRGKPRPHPLGRSRFLQHLPGEEAAHRVCLGSACLPGRAPRACGDGSGPDRVVRPPTRAAARSQHRARGTRPGHWTARTQQGARCL